MTTWFLRLLVSLTLATLLLTPLVTSANELDIPFEKYVLDNGLTLIVHTDRKAPVVAVNLWVSRGLKK